MNGAGGFLSWQWGNRVPVFLDASSRPSYCSADCRRVGRCGPGALFEPGELAPGNGSEMDEL